MVVSSMLRVECMHDRVLLVTILGSNSIESYSWGTRKCEHRINPYLVDALNSALDGALSNASVSAVVVTAEGKFFCNGMDLKWIEENMDKADNLQAATERLLARILCFPLPTIAAINGHFCAAGCMLGLAFDHRIMTTDSGVCFVPAIDIGLVYSPGMTNLMKSKCPPHMHNEMIVYGTRYNALQLKQERVIREARPDAEVVPRAIDLALELTSNNRFLGAKYRETMQGIKLNTYKGPYESLVNPLEFKGMGFVSGTWDNRGRSKI